MLPYFLPGCPRRQIPASGQWGDSFDPDPSLSHIVICFDHKMAKIESSSGIPVSGWSKQGEDAKKENNSNKNKY